MLRVVSGSVLVPCTVNIICLCVYPGAIVRYAFPTVEFLIEIPWILPQAPDRSAKPYANGNKHTNAHVRDHTSIRSRNNAYEEVAVSSVTDQRDDTA